MGRAASAEAHRCQHRPRRSLRPASCRRSEHRRGRSRRRCGRAGHDVVVGIDEVGRGAWAGPLSVGAAILPCDTRVNGVRDSKLLSEREREALFDRLTDWCVAWSVGSASQEECDQLGMSAAQKLAAKRAIEGLGVAPDVAVTDGKWDFVSPSVPNVELAVKADLRCLSVATASILAKVVRDPRDACPRRELPALVVRHQQGLPVPRAQVGPGRLRPIRHPPPHVGVHGPLRSVVRHPPDPACGPIDVVLMSASDEGVKEGEH